MRYLLSLSQHIHKFNIIRNTQSGTTVVIVLPTHPEEILVVETECKVVCGHPDLSMERIPENNRLHVERRIEEVGGVRGTYIKQIIC